MQALYLGNPASILRVYGQEQREKVHSRVEISDKVYTMDEVYAHLNTQKVEVIFSTWGMPSLTEEEITRFFPSLKAVFYGAGSVQGFAAPFLNKGVRVFSAWLANGVPVAEYTFAQMALAAKGYFRLQKLTREDRKNALDEMKHYPGFYEIKIGLLGLGAIGSLVAEKLQTAACTVLAFDPFASDEKMAHYGVKRASMEEIFSTCQIVSNHLANLPTTQEIIKRQHLLSMQPYSTFINTGRGAQLSETDLYDLLTQNPTVTALLDVMIDETHSNESPLNTLPNCFITPHVAGSMGNEVHRMSEYMIEAFDCFEKNLPSKCEVTLEMLLTMA